MNNLGKHGSTIFKDTFTDKNDINTILFGIFELFNVLGIVFFDKNTYSCIVISLPMYKI